MAVLALAVVCQPASAQTTSTRKSHPKAAAKSSAQKKPATQAKSSSAPVSTAAQQLSALARQLSQKEPPAGAYWQLVQFATAHAESPLAPRAALALGYFDFKQKDFVEARKWFEKASADIMLSDYALYWTGMTDRATGDNAAALREFQQYRQRYPGGVMAESAVEEFARAALAVGQPQDAVAALEGYEKTANKGELILLRAQGREQVATAHGEPPLAAASDYLDVYYRFPLSEEAKVAGGRIPTLQTALGEQFPGTPLANEIARAEAFNEASRWSELRDAYRALLPKISGSARERAQLRIAQADAALGGGIDELASLQLTDPDLDAERLYLLSQEYRAQNAESTMLDFVDQAFQKYPQSPATADALFAAGNYFWMKLDRQKASEYYGKLIGAFPANPNVSAAQWRIVWTAYMARSDARDQIEQYLRQYPNSAYVVDALYFLGRSEERAGNVPHARSFYLAAVQRFPQTYFGSCAAARLHEIGAEPTDPAEFLSLFPLAAPLPPLNTSVPAAANDRWQRAQALHNIAFDSSAELELRAAYEQTPAPSLMLAIAQAASDSGHYPAGIIAARQLVPRLEARQFEDVPMELWRAIYPLPYRSQIEREAARNKLDPFLVAGLIRQESAFASDAVSVSNALGLTQVWPPTGAILARTLKVSYSRARLLDPDYNLRLGTYYLSSLLNMFGKPEFAVAAYNAGENRVTEWTAGQNYEELPEFVESIPITQTRDYVQIVLRNAGLYRRIYRAAGAVSASAESPQPSQK